MFTFESAHSVKSYEGRRSDDQTSVTVDGKPLNPRFDLWPYDFSGFEWGYVGSGSMQLALALLADHLNDEKRAAALCAMFAHTVVAKLPYAGWNLSSTQIQKALFSEATNRCFR